MIVLSATLYRYSRRTGYFSSHWRNHEKLLISVARLACSACRCILDGLLPKSDHDCACGHDRDDGDEICDASVQRRSWDDMSATHAGGGSGMGCTSGAGAARATGTDRGAQANASGAAKGSSGSRKAPSGVKNNTGQTQERPRHRCRPRTAAGRACMSGATPLACGPASVFVGAILRRPVSLPRDTVKLDRKPVPDGADKG